MLIFGILSFQTYDANRLGKVVQHNKEYLVKQKHLSEY